MEKKVKLTELTMRELLDYEEASTLLREYYTAMIRRYDGTLSPGMDNEAKKLIEIDAVHQAIIKHLEDRVRHVE